MPVKIFFCYAHEDEILLNKLKAHLKPLQRQGLIDVWHDRDIGAGAEWEQEIKDQLNAAQIILLLVSPDFMDSDYCYGIEMQRALERHEQGEAQVIPIILRPVYFEGTPFRKLQALPKDGKAVTKWRNRDEAFQDVVRGIGETIKTLHPQQGEKANIQSSYTSKEKVVNKSDSGTQQLNASPFYQQQLPKTSSTPTSPSKEMPAPTAISRRNSILSLRHSQRQVIVLVGLVILLLGVSFTFVISNQNEQAAIRTLENTNATLQAQLSPFISNAATSVPGLETRFYRFILNVDVNGLLNNLQQAINAVKQQVQAQPFLHNRNVGLAIVYGEAANNSQIQTSLDVAQRVYAIFRMLGQEGIIFKKASYYNPLYIIGGNDSEVAVAVYRYSE